MSGIFWATALAAAQPQVVVTVPTEHALVEGVATDGRTIWASSVLDRTIVECQTNCRTLAVLPDGLHPLGIAWDESRKTLWIAADCPKIDAVEPCEQGALVELSLRGTIRARIAPQSGAFHPGDVSVADREIFVSDSSNGAVYRLTPNEAELSFVVPPGVGKSAQGTALDSGNDRLIVADYSQGIAAVDLSNGARMLLPRPDSRPLRGIDGLVRCGSGYVAIYNGASPGRLVRIQIRQAQIEVGELIPGLTFPDPTQIAFDGKRLLIVGNSGWALVDSPAKARSEGALIVSIPVGDQCQPE